MNSLKHRIDVFLEHFTRLGNYGFEESTGINGLLRELGRTVNGDDGKLGWVAGHYQDVALPALNRVVAACSRLLDIFTPTFIKEDKARAERQLSAISRQLSGRRRAIESEESVSHGLAGGWSRSAAASSSKSTRRAGAGADGQSRCVNARVLIMDTIVADLKNIYDEAVDLAKVVADPPQR